MAACDERRLRFHVKIRVYYDNPHFGPGMATVMGLVRETQSLREACARMNMAYSKAWRLVRQAEADLGVTLMEGSRGGKSGGKTVLTKDGEEFLDRYTAFSEDAQRAVEKLFADHYGGWGKKAQDDAEGHKGKDK
ncbi:MAG: LysR family transcriptional regulator [Lachnospiraceae bacterium]|jgi:molybdate transport system regulatory protein|nr:LysR family transcriptional regulator [Lachnospiraceae bacterium]